MATKFTFFKEYTAHTMRRDDYVIIPDQVALDQKAYDTCTFPVLRSDGRKARAALMGSEYGLWTGGTGDPVVRMA